MAWTMAVGLHLLTHVHHPNVICFGVQCCSTTARYVHMDWSGPCHSRSDACAVHQSAATKQDISVQLVI